MRNEHATLQAQLSSARTNVERLTLRLEDAQSALAEKERLNNDIQQEKAALKVQLGKWKSLDDRGGAEVEELHKQRVALEDQIKRLESRLAEKQSKASVHENASQKEHKKIVKLQQALEEQVVRTRIGFSGPRFLSLSYSVLLRKQKLQRKRTTKVMGIPRRIRRYRS
jgi:chromosome segregation ATPase